MIRPGAGEVLVLALALFAWPPAVVADEAADAGKAPPAKVRIRPKYALDLVLRYRLKLVGATAWTPRVRGLRWGKMDTDFTFMLAAKALRRTGACTFRLLGEGLRSQGEGPDGAIGIEASRRRSRVKVKDRWQVWLDKSPLARPMTLTLGKLGGFRFGTGLAPVAIYMLPHVDQRFWAVLTAAPLREVAPGDRWRQEIDLPVPGAKGKPLKLKGTWQVVGWRKHRDEKVLAITLEASLTLEGSDLMLRNGDVIHVTHGTCQATGKVLWDVEAGLPRLAEARQRILIKADKPAARALRSEAKCSLEQLRLPRPKADE
jgi:hypothetical protein